VDFANGLEDHVPVGATKVRGCAEAGNGVLFGVGIVDHDVCCVVGLDLGGEVLKVLLARVMSKETMEGLPCESQCGLLYPEIRSQEAKT
jgi:hypothetical protein